MHYIKVKSLENSSPVEKKNHIVNRREREENKIPERRVMLSPLVRHSEGASSFGNSYEQKLRLLPCRG